MDLSRFTEHVGEGSMEETLDTLGFAVVDGAFGGDFCRAVREEIDYLEQQNLLNSGKNILTNAQGEGVTMVRPNIFERDLVLESKVTDDNVLQLLPTLNKIYWEQNLEFTAILGRGYNRLQLKCIDTIKVQKNTGQGGCFPMHFDTSAITSKRDLTAVIYLNAEWTEASGGHLRVYPFPYERVDVAPLNDRMVLFSSHQLAHRVMPSAHTRYVLSLWFRREGEPVSFPRMPLPATSLPFEDQQILAFLYRPTNRRVLAKLLYASEWADSVREAFGVCTIAILSLQAVKGEGKGDKRGRELKRRKDRKIESEHFYPPMNVSYACKCMYLCMYGWMYAWMDGWMFIRSCLQYLSILFICI